MKASREKTSLPLATDISPCHGQTQVPSKRSIRTARSHGLRAIFLCFILYLSFRLHYALPTYLGHDDKELCPQVDVLIPQRNLATWEALGKTIGTDQFKLRAAEWLGGAVRVPTESYDEMEPVGQDPRWDVFGLFHDYLHEAFPQVHSTLSLTKVNTYALWYEWKGSDASLKPLLLAAHADVVPVNPETVEQWTHPPYSGHFDGKRIWGRGSSDDKSGLIGILSVVESLLELGFKPTRTIVLAFGIDEEASGKQGAGALAKTLLKAYGENAFAIIVDEGSGFMNLYGGTFATPAISEKGYLDVRVEISAAGGHSSIPPEHTSIGILAALIVKFEANPFKVSLARTSPVYSSVKCLAVHAPNLPSDLRKTIKRSAHSDRALRKLESTLFSDPTYKSLVGTTQAIDLVQGGVKANALPESAWALVNHRISTESSVAEVQTHDTDLLRDLVAGFNLTYDAFGVRVTVPGPAAGALVLSDAWASALEPAPVTPITAPPYLLLSGTIKATYNAHRGLTGADNIAVAPSIMPGNTDTQFYWKLSEHIFRYNHGNAASSGEDPMGGIHTVNESIDVDAFLEMIRFFATLILNVDEATSF